jgi:hypothetical protein
VGLVAQTSALGNAGMPYDHDENVGVVGEFAIFSGVLVVETPD